VHESQPSLLGRRRANGPKNTGVSDGLDGCSVDENGSTIENKMDLVFWDQWPGDCSMREPGWSEIVEMSIVCLLALIVGIVTKVGERRDDADLGYIIRRYARILGLMIGIGGWVGVIHLLLIKLGYVSR